MVEKSEISMLRKIRMLACTSCIVSIIVLLAACSTQSVLPPSSSGQGNGNGRSPQSTASSSTSSSAQFALSSSPIPTNSVLASLNLSALPIGDNRTTTSGPQANHLYVCTTAPFSRGGGAAISGPWMSSNGTYNLASKVSADGNITWKNPQLSVTVNGSTRVVHTNDLPSVPTGIFPILPNTTAYEYDRNPNAITAQTITLNLPANPADAARPTCVSGGTIGVMLDGAVLFDSVDAGGRDAVAHEVQDGCGGHPQMNGVYHYHSLSPCMNFGSPSAGTSPLLGYALDGYGIYGPFQDGKLLANSDLDACHGTTSAVQWGGQTVTMYHYVANFEFPYTLGCYHGTPVQTGGPQG